MKLSGRVNLRCWTDGEASVHPQKCILFLYRRCSQSVSAWENSFCCCITGISCVLFCLGVFAVVHFLFLVWFWVWSSFQARAFSANFSAFDCTHIQINLNYCYFFSIQERLRTASLQFLGQKSSQLPTDFSYCLLFVFEISQKKKIFLCTVHLGTIDRVYETNRNLRCI